MSLGIWVKGQEICPNLCIGLYGLYHEGPFRRYLTALMLWGVNFDIYCD